MFLKIKAYNGRGRLVKEYCFTWAGSRYKSTRWYRNLTWMYTSPVVARFDIVDKKTVIETVARPLPQ